MDGTSTLLNFSSVIAAFTAVGVAGWQGWLQRQSLKHSLYDKRIKLYLAISQYIHYVNAGEEGTCTACSLDRESREAEFVFGPDVVQLIQEIVFKGMQLRNENYLLDKNSTSAFTTDSTERRVSLHRYFCLEVQDKLRNVMIPYLRLSDGQDARPFFH